MTVSIQTEPCEETVIVFGGAGFIGTHLMQRLLSMGAKRSSASTPASQNGQFPASTTVLPMCGTSQGCNSMAQCR